MNFKYIVLNCFLNQKFMNISRYNNNSTMLEKEEAIFLFSWSSWTFFARAESQQQKFDGLRSENRSYV